MERKAIPCLVRRQKQKVFFAKKIAVGFATTSSMKVPLTFQTIVSHGFKSKQLSEFLFLGMSDVVHFAGTFPELGIKRCCFLEGSAESPARVAFLDASNDDLKSTIFIANVM